MLSRDQVRIVDTLLLTLCILCGLSVWALIWVVWPLMEGPWLALALTAATLYTSGLVSTIRSGGFKVRR